MTKITKLIPIENCNTLTLIKRTTVKNNKKYECKNYYAKFYVGRELSKDGFKLISLKTSDERLATKKAKEVWLDFLANKNSTPILKKKHTVIPNMICRYFYNKYHLELLERANLKEIDDNLVHSTNTRYFTEIDNVIGDLNIKDIHTEHFEKIKMNLITNKKEPKTINNYFTIIKGIFKKAIELNAVQLVPTFPKIKFKKPSSFQPYTKDEIHQITNELRRISKTDLRYPHYDEIADIVNFLYFVPLRPGKEFLSLTHNDVKIITSIQRQEILVIDPPHRKVQQNNNPLPSHPIAKDIYLRRICKRYPRVTGSEYLFFNHDKNRETLQRKIGKIFVKISRKLGLYVQNKSSKRHRPLYSLRASNFIETYAKSGNLDLIAKVGNTSTNMLNSRYLQKFSEQKIVEIYNKLYSN